MDPPNSGDQYNLKWNNHLANFVQTFIEHQNGESLVDVTLSCEGQYIKAHKLILSACSDYFHSIFQVHTGVPHPFILLNGVRFTDLKYILHFMYHGEVKVLDKDLPSVLSLGETLQIKGLSSVKLRDMPSEPPQTPQATKSYSNSRKYHTIVPKGALPVPVAMPTEVPYYPLANHKKNNFISPKNDVKPLLDDSRGRSPQEVRKSPLVSSPLAQNNDVQKVSSSTSSQNIEESTIKNHSVIAVSESPPMKPSTPNDVRSITNGESSKDSIPPKPPHAFMIFANEWRKKLTIEHPEENNKEISVRLGNMWKNLLPETKNIYYKAAKRAEEDHKAKYPSISSSESLKRKSDVLNDSTNTSSSPVTSVDPMEIVETQEQICISDTD